MITHRRMKAFNLTGSVNVFLAIVDGKKVAEQSYFFQKLEHDFPGTNQ